MRGELKFGRPLTAAESLFVQALHRDQVDELLKMLLAAELVRVNDVNCDFSGPNSFEFIISLSVQL